MFPHARSALAALVVALLATLTACDDDSTSDDPAGSVTGRDSTVTSALLTSTDLGADFSRTDDGDLGLPDGTGIGCLTDQLDATTPLDRAEVAFDHGDEGFPVVFNTVEIYRSPAEVEQLMADLRADIADCDDRTESHGGLDFEVDIDDRDLPVPAGVDDQIAFDARGSVGAGGASFDIDLSLLVAIVGRRVTMVGVADLGGNPIGVLAPYALLAEQRLVDSSHL